MQDILTIDQCCYIMSKSYPYMMNQINNGSLICKNKKKSGSKNTYIIEQSEIEKHIYQEILKNERLINYANHNFNASFWKENGYSGKGKQIVINGHKYITVTQIAFLFNISRQAVHARYLESNKLSYITITKSKKKYKTKLIDVRSLNNKTKPLRKMLMYISEPDKSKFWDIHMENVKRGNYYEV